MCAVISVRGFCSCFIIIIIIIIIVRHYGADTNKEWQCV
jgi:hypothetical protein